jgi:hypothetical protein
MESHPDSQNELDRLNALFEKAREAHYADWTKDSPVPVTDGVQMTVTAVRGRMDCPHCDHRSGNLNVDLLDDSGKRIWLGNDTIGHQMIEHPDEENVQAFRSLAGFNVQPTAFDPSEDLSSGFTVDPLMPERQRLQRALHALEQQGVSTELIADVRDGDGSLRPIATRPDEWKLYRAESLAAGRPDPMDKLREHKAREAEARAEREPQRPALGPLGQVRPTSQQPPTGRDRWWPTDGFER